MSEPTTPRLERNALGVLNGVALAAAAMAPVLAVVLNAPAAAPAAGAALPLAFLIAFIACLLTGNTVIQFARRVPATGSFYAYTASALGQTAGFFTAWLYWIGYAVLAPGLATAFGSLTHDLLVSAFGVEVPWWILSVAAMAVVLGLSIRSIKASLRVDLALLAAEVVVFLLLAAIAVWRADNTASVFLPSSAPGGVSGVGIGVVFGLLSFVGFDAAATLAEETRNPRRSVPLAVGGALVFVGLFYIATTYALVVAYPMTSAEGLAAFLKDGNAFGTLARSRAPWLEPLVDVCAVTGLFTCLLAVHNATVRILFSMGREGVLPSALARVHTRWFSPYAAILAQTAFTLGVGLPLGVWLGPGASGAYAFAGTIGTVAVVLVYVLGNAALVRASATLQDRNIVAHVIAPSLGILSLLYPLATVCDPRQDFPFNLVPVIVGVWLLVGVAAFALLRAHAPEKIASLGAYLADDAEG